MTIVISQPTVRPKGLWCSTCFEQKFVDHLIGTARERNVALPFHEGMIPDVMGGQLHQSIALAAVCLCQLLQ